MKILTAIICCGLSSAIFAQNLSLSDYLNEVRESNGNYTSGKLKSEAFKQKEAEADLVYSSQLEASVKYIDDGKPTTTPSIQGDKTKLNIASIGISKPTRIGLNADVSYNAARTEIVGADPSLVTNNQFYENYAQVKLTQSLYRNFLGSEIKSREESIRKAAMSGRLNQEFINMQLLSEAENIYFQYIIAQKRVLIQEAAKKRADSLVKWTKAKTRKNLADKTDFLQANAALKSRELDLKIAKDNVRILANALNSLRGVNSSIVKEQVDTNLVDYISQITIPKRREQRLDTLATKYNLESQKAQFALSAEALRPDLKLEGSASLYGKTNNFTDSTSDSFGSKNPVYSVGVTFTMPLDFSAKEKAKSSYLASKNAAEVEYKRKELDETIEWENLSSLFDEQKEQLEIYKELEEAQRIKALNESKRQRNGLSTTFQVLSFEQEYLSTLSQRLSKQSEIIQTYTQLKLFN